MAKYLIEFNAIVGRKKPDIATEDPGASLHSPIQLTYFATTDAATLEAVNDKIVLYKDPGYVTSVVNITELPENLASSELCSKLDLDNIIKDLG